MTPAVPRPHLGILTSGGDAQGMNAAVRAVVRTALSRGARVSAIYEGFQGMVDGGDGIRELDWADVSGILHRGGTVIGTYRSKDFRQWEGRRRAARNLLGHGIDRLIVIGGDGSLSGLDQFRADWPGLLTELVEAGEITPETAAAYPALTFAGLVGSIDNDLVGTDSTIGADSALHRIIDAIDALASTAASHQRCFVVEVMGRNCGYLPLMAAIAGGCDYVLIPEHPPADGWEDVMSASVRQARLNGRRDTMVVVAEGARDRHGAPITADYVCQALTERLGEDGRVTILGHVQRGGSPSAYDRWASTWLGYEAAREVLDAAPGGVGAVIGFHGNQVIRLPLVEAVARTREVPTLIESGQYAQAMTRRGGAFTEMGLLLAELVNPDQPATLTGPSAGSGRPPGIASAATGKRIAILHAGGLAPGMNSAARYAVRLGIRRGHTMLGVRDGFTGLRDQQFEELGWADVEGWLADGGANLGVRRTMPSAADLYPICRALEEHRVDALIMIGGWNGYQAIHLLHRERDRYPALRMPMVCVPASIDNNLPGTEISIGSDTALNVITEAIDRLKVSGAAAKRAFVVETMGRHCGYLALLSGLAGGAERVYLPEEGLTLEELQRDVAWLRESFAAGRKLFLAVRNEEANPLYTTDFIARVLEEEGRGLYDVRQSVLGHVQQGATPSPSDRLLAARLVSHALHTLGEQFAAGTAESHYLGLADGGVRRFDIAHLNEHVDVAFRRPRDQWWLALRPVLEAVAEPV